MHLVGDADQVDVFRSRWKQMLRITVKKCLHERPQSSVVETLANSRPTAEKGRFMPFE
jgi:hypothetical protein